MKAVIDSMLSQPNWRKKAIGMLIVVEGYAMGVFAFMRRSTTDPLLERILSLVMQDEGRHVGFGIESIAAEARDCSAREWRELQSYAFSLIRSLYHARERGGMRSSLDQYWRHEKGRMGLSRHAFEDRALDNLGRERFQHELFHDTLLPSLTDTRPVGWANSERVPKPRNRKNGESRMTFIEELQDALMPEYGRLLETRIFQALSSDDKAGGGRYPRPMDSLEVLSLGDLPLHQAQRGQPGALCDADPHHRKEAPQAPASPRHRGD